MASTTTNTRITRAPMGGSLIDHLLTALIAWYETRQTRNALSRLTDRQLDDIGLTRADIEGSIR